MKSKNKLGEDFVVEEREMSSAEVKTNGPETKNGIIANGLFVKVRKDPSNESDENVIEVLRKGDKVTILGRVKNFYRVSTSVNKEGYILSLYVKEE